MVCLDTTVFIDLAGRGGAAHRDAAQAKIIQIVNSGESLATTRFNVAELLVGVERSRDPIAERRRVDSMLAQIPILEFDEPAAFYFARLAAHLMTRGQPIGDMDLLIASVAIANSQKILSRNVRHFLAIPGLQVESY